VIKIVKFLKDFKIGKYNITTVRTANITRKVPTQEAHFEYHFFVKEKKKDVLQLHVPANNYKSAICGLKGSMRVKKLIKDNRK